MTDVLVVGAGISGVLIAESLASDGFAVAVVDRRGIAAGSTAASTSLIQYAIDKPLSHLARKIGEELAVRTWRRSFQSLHNLASRTQTLGIECGRMERPSLYLAGGVLDGRGMRREAAARRAAGFECELLSRTQLSEEYGVKRPAGILARGDFTADPVRLTKGYLRAAAASGAQIYVPLDVVGVSSGTHGVRAETNAGHSISAQVVVFATGYEFPQFVPLVGHSLVSTFALTTKRQQRSLWRDQCIIWEASDPYLYLRTTHDGRAIIGGEDEAFADTERRDAVLEKKVRAIGKKANRLLPSLDTTPEYAWAGTFGVSEDGLPTIGEVPGRRNCWAVLGYGGNGITFSRIAAEIIRTTLTGGTDPDADLFDFRTRGRSSRQGSSTPLHGGREQ